MTPSPDGKREADRVRALLLRACRFARMEKALAEIVRMGTNPPYAEKGICLEQAIDIARSALCDEEPQGDPHA